MFPSETRVSQLIRESEKQGHIFVQTIAIDPPAMADRRATKIFGVFQTMAGHRVGDALIAHIEDGLTQGIREALGKLPTTANPALIFESAVARLNQRLTRLIEERGLTAQELSMSSVIAAQYGKELVMATMGKPTVLLIRASVTGKTSVYNLLAGSDAPNAAPAVSYTNIVNGALTPDDRLMLATEDLRKVFDPASLADIIAGNDPVSATTILRNSLTGKSTAGSFAAMILDSGPTAGAMPTRSAEPVRVPLRPAIAPTAMLQEKKVETIPVQIEPKKPSAFLIALKKTLPIIKRAGAELKHSLIALTNKEKRAAIIPTAKANLDRRLEWAVESFNGLSAAKRIMLFVILGAIVTGNAALAAASVRGRIAAAAAAYENGIFAIEQKIDSAEASIIYRDEARAKTILAEARQEIAALPEKRTDQKAEKERLSGLISAKLDLLRHAVPLGAPTVLADIAADQGAPRLTKIGVSSSIIWSASATGTLYKTSLKDGNTIPVEGVNLGEASPALLSAAESGLIAVGAAGKVGMVPATGKSSLKNYPLEADMALADVALYEGKIYGLDPARNRIVRFNPTGSGYSSGQSYLKDGTDLANAAALDVDGSIFVLMNDGAVVRLLKGVRTDLALPAVDPAFGKPVAISATTDSERIFILDTDPGRVAVFDKNSGTLFGQYTSDSLKSATDFFIDESAKMLYAVAGSQVLKFDLPELK